MRKIWTEKCFSEEALKKVADLSRQEIVDEDNEYVKKMESIDETFPIEPDQKFLEFAREFDGKKKKRDRAQKIKRFSQVAAVFLVCIVVTLSVALEASDAFRVRLYSLIFNSENGSVSLSEEESDLIGDWKDYWYPEFIPEGFNLIAAEDDGGQRILLFESNDGKFNFQIIDMPLDTSVSVDTDTNTIEEIKIGHYRGYMFVDDIYDSIMLFWKTDDRQMMIDARNGIKEDTVKRIAEGLKYVG